MPDRRVHLATPSQTVQRRASNGGTAAMGIIEFLHETGWKDLPDQVRSQARRCLLDTIGAALGGRGTALSDIVHDFAATVYRGQEADLWLDGRKVSPSGAALANGMTIDALDSHDGYKLVKGHAGAALVPAALATLAVSREQVSGQELLTTLVLGYEVALRAGLALHATACDYHSSGAWNALGCAAIVARRLGLGADQTRHTLGIAEYSGPRSQMMRCIDQPTMIKDGSGWGAMTGVSAALLARGGFTGAPALTVESPDVAAVWANLGTKWLITEQYFKPYPVCYWAQPAIAGALALRRSHDLSLQAINRIQVFTFHEATRLACRHPRTTEEAQYSLPFSVAATLVHRELGLAQLSGAALRDPLLLRLSDRVELVDDPDLTRRFPAERLARVRIETSGGALVDSGDVRARWDGPALPADGELRAKFLRLAYDGGTGARATALCDMIWHSADLADAASLTALLAPPVDQ